MSLCFSLLPMASSCTLIRSSQILPPPPDDRHTLGMTVIR